MPQRITPSLWLDTQAEEAATFYTSVFPNSRILRVTRYPDGGPRAAGMVMTVEFELDGQRLVALNGGPEFTFDEAISLEISCETQEDVDYYWGRLADGGEKGSADGSRTATASPGRSFQPRCGSCSAIETRSGRSARCRISSHSVWYTAAASSCPRATAATPPSPVRWDSSGGTLSPATTGSAPATPAAPAPMAPSEP